VSNALAIAAVTAALQRLLAAGVTADLPAALPGSHNLANTRVTTSSPDRARAHGESINQVNVHLLQVAPSGSLRNQDLARVALELHYLITVHPAGDDETSAQILLGQVVRILHEHAQLGPADLRDALPGADLEHQLERVRLTPRPATSDDMSRVWSMYQTPARLGVLYSAAVILIDAAPRPAALPVLHVGRTVQPDLASPFPVLHDLAPAGPLRPGQPFTVRGHQLAGDSVELRLTHARATAEHLLPVADPTALTLASTLPNDPATLPAGLYTLTAVIHHGDRERSSNPLPLTVLPEITTPLPLELARDPQGAVTLLLKCRPTLRPEQRVSVLLGDRDVPAPPRATASDTLTVLVRAAAPGEHLLRLRVDGVDSTLLDPLAAKPAFDLARKVVIT
jgi:hypothetical protein